MRTTTKLELRPIAELKPYEHNARTHSPEQIEKLRASMREFGFVAPVLITAEGGVIAGHGRIEAAALEGFTEAPCVLVDHLTEAQRRAYILADNRLAELAAWDMDSVGAELLALGDAGFCVQLTGFELQGLALEPVDGGNFRGRVETETSEEYEALKEKYTIKRTTDDCYTPDNVYAAVKKWVCTEYELETCRVVRPFYPGGDYQRADYTENCVVIDNPPFSIISEICRWYLDHNIRFFLFAPGTTLFSIAAGAVNYLPTGLQIEYENGAYINTSFVTNMGRYKLDTAPDLYAAVDAMNKENLRKKSVPLPKYVYPDNLVTVATNTLSKRGERLQIEANEMLFVRDLDAQHDSKRTIFGGGFLLSDEATARKVAAEKSAAEKSAAISWPLSEREKNLISKLGGANEQN